MNQIQTLTVRGEQAYVELGRLRSQYPRTGRYPVCLGDLKEGMDMLNTLPSAADAAFYIANSLNIDPVRWFTEVLGDEPRHYRAHEGEWPASAAGEDEEYEPFTIEVELSLEPDKELLIALFPVSAPWEVFAHLGWGGGNECPGQAEHCAIHRYWGSLYQTEIAILTRDLIRCQVGRPPKNREESLHLAREQFAYSADFDESFMQHAATLLDAPEWYFWWD